MGFFYLFPNISFWKSRLSLQHNTFWYESKFIFEITSCLKEDLCWERQWSSALNSSSIFLWYVWCILTLLWNSSSFLARRPGQTVPKPVETGTRNVLFGSFAGTDEKYHCRIRRLGLLRWEAEKSKVLQAPSVFSL